MKKIFSLWLFTILSLFVSAQIVDSPTELNMRVNTRINIEKTNFRITYRHIATLDPAHPDKKKENEMYLDIGSNVSKYIDRKRIIVDSLTMLYATKGTDIERLSKQSVSLLRNSVSEIILKNYPRSKITVYDRIPFNTYVYEEDLVVPKWQLEEGNLTVCGYACKKATTTFRGRNYTAWYTLEIPLSNGPWKFTGLPGLILKVKDDKNHYIMECIGIEKKDGTEDIYVSISKREIKTDKAKFQKGLAEYHKNPGAHIANTGLVKSEIPPHVYKARPYNPIELSN